MEGGKQIVRSAAPWGGVEVRDATTGAWIALWQGVHATSPRGDPE